jgi:hypothetical protein
LADIVLIDDHIHDPWLITGMDIHEVESGHEVVEVGRVMRARSRLFAVFHQLGQSILADRLQHGETRREGIGAGLTHHEALIDEGVKAGEHIRERQSADGRRALQRPAPGEDGQAPEE